MRGPGGPGGPTSVRTSRNAGPSRATNAGPAARGVIELGTITQPEHRERGYATIVSARIALECERLGYQTHWNCAKDNPASAAIARRLGYRNVQEFQLLVWPKLPSA